MAVVPIVYLWKATSSGNDYPYSYGSMGSLTKQADIEFPVLTISYYGPGGRRLNAIFDSFYFNEHLRFELIDRWIAVVCFENEVAVIDEALGYDASSVEL